MPASVKQLRDNQNNFIYPKIAKEGLVEPIYGSDVGISAINGLQSSTVQGALNELAGNNVEIVKTASGSVISVSDSADYRLLGLKLYGKSVQDGVPTPEAPVEIESAGDSGNITVTLSDGAEQSQTLTYPTLNGLLGIPVESGGNYTDAEGQQWYCDIVDLSSGVYLQNVEYINAKDKKWRVNVSWSNINGNCVLAYYVTDAPYISHVLSNKLKAVTYSSSPEAYKEYEITVEKQPNTIKSVIYISIPLTVVGEATNEAFATYLESAGIHILAPKAMTTQDIDISLTSDPLTTYKPNTTITTDSDPAAGIEVKYLTDSGVSEVLDYYASKADLDGKQDKITGTTGQFVGFDAEGEAEAQEITAEDVGAMAAVDGGTTGQYLRKTADGQAWQDGPDLSGYAITADVAETYAKKALKFTGTFTAAGWTSATGRYSQTINVSGLTADDEPIIDLNSTATDADTFNGQLEAFGLVSNFTTGAGTLTAVVLGDSAPTVDIPIHGVVVY